MKLLGQILLVSVLLCILQALVAVIAIAIILLLLWGLLFRTRETVGLIAFCFLVQALQVHPIVTICSIGLLGGVLLIARSKRSGASSCKPPVRLLAPPSPPPN